MIQKKAIELGKNKKGENRTLMIKYNSLENGDDDEEVDIERIVKIDFNNITAELVTVPVLLAQFSIYIAELNERVNLSKMNMEVKEAELATKFREDHKEETGKDLSNEKTKDKIMVDPNYKVKRVLYFKTMKEHEIMSGIYWSLKSKDDKLSKLANSVNLADSIESTITNKIKKFNYVDIAVVKTKE